MPSLALRPPNRLTGLIAATALAVSALVVAPSPARASDDLLRLLLGATAVAIIVHSATRSSGSSPQQQTKGLPPHCRETLGIHGRHVAVYNARCLHQAGLRNLPQRCHEVVRTNRGQRGVYRAQCLERTYSGHHQPRARGHGHGHAKHLPDHCRTRYSYRGQQHWGYRSGCLQRARVRDLPQTCQVRQSDGRLYSAHCLRQHGFR